MVSGWANFLSEYGWTKVEYRGITALFIVLNGLYEFSSLRLTTLV